MCSQACCNLFPGECSPNTNVFASFSFDLFLRLKSCSEMQRTDVTQYCCPLSRALVFCTVEYLQYFGMLQLIKRKICDKTCLSSDIRRLSENSTSLRCSWMSRFLNWLGIRGDCSNRVRRSGETTGKEVTCKKTSATLQCCIGKTACVTIADYWA